MGIFILLLFFFVLLIIELLYFKIADKYNIIDHPNHRSSHTNITIRGGGIIFCLAMLLGSLYFKFDYPYFILGLSLISLISLVDDIKPVSNKTRIIFHLISVILLFYQLGMYVMPLYWVILGFVFAIGTINAINFMDGINGITGGFGLVTLFTLFAINKYSVSYTDGNHLTISILSLIVFNLFNFRKKAKCFAGDVGSVGLGFIILFFLLQLILKTNNLNYLLILLVYGLDTVTTIMFRYFQKENIFQAHRRHFYQFWANEKKIPHLVVAIAYIIVQGVINLALVKFNPTSVVNLILSVTIAAIIFILLRIYFEGLNKLFRMKN